MKTHVTNLVGKIFVSLLLSGIAAFWSLQVFGAEWSEAQKEIWNLEKKYWECIKNADVETYKNLLHDNVIVMRAHLLFSFSIMLPWFVLSMNILVTCVLIVVVLPTLG